MIVDGPASGLDDEDIFAPDRVLDLAPALATRELAEDAVPGRDVEIVADGVGELRVRVAREHDNVSHHDSSAGVAARRRSAVPVARVLAHSVRGQGAGRRRLCLIGTGWGEEVWDMDLPESCVLMGGLKRKMRRCEARGSTGRDDREAASVKKQPSSLAYRGEKRVDLEPFDTWVLKHRNSRMARSIVFIMGSRQGLDKQHACSMAAAAVLFLEATVAGVSNIGNMSPY